KSPPTAPPSNTTSPPLLASSKPTATSSTPATPSSTRKSCTFKPRNLSPNPPTRQKRSCEDPAMCSSSPPGQSWPGTCPSESLST
ncbi:hypothetical protein LTR16_012715, partial [Cryomyces antarcticus]